jgi:hypothetical protein
MDTSVSVDIILTSKFSYWISMLMSSDEICIAVRHLQSIILVH